MKTYEAGIVAIAKNENRYLLEWAAYHLALGFQHIWIYDNGSDIKLSSVFSRFKARRYITLIDWPNSADGRTQINAYNHYLVKFGKRVAWTAIIDIDEMVCLKKHDRISHFLDDYPEATGIAINWRFFGSNGQTGCDDRCVMERFTRASSLDNAINEGVKTIHRTGSVNFMMPHYSLYRDIEHVVSANGNKAVNDWKIPIDESNFSIAQINHYFVKSPEEWDAKLHRHRLYSSDDRSQHYDMCDRNDVEDLSILRLVNQTKAWMRKIGRHRTPFGCLRRGRAFAWTAWDADPTPKP